MNIQQFITSKSKVQTDENSALSPQVENRDDERLASEFSPGSGSFRS